MVKNIKRRDDLSHNGRVREADFAVESGAWWREGGEEASERNVGKVKKVLHDGDVQQGADHWGDGFSGIKIERTDRETCQPAVPVWVKDQVAGNRECGVCLSIGRVDQLVKVEFLRNECDLWRKRRFLLWKFNGH